MVVQLEPALSGNLLLSRFDFGVDELLDPPAVQAHEVIVMRSLVEFEHRAAALEVIS